MLRTATCVVMAAFCTGCATVAANPAMFQSKRVAILSFYGSRSIDATGLGPQGLIQGINTWGEKVLTEQTPRILEDLKAGLDAEVLLPQDLSSNATYQTMPVPSLKETLAAAPGMRMVDIAKADWPKIGAFAKELGVDAAAVFFQNYEIREDRNTHEQHALVIMWVLVVDPNGQALYFDQIKTESAPMPGSLEGVATQTFRLVAEKLSQRMVADAAVRSIHAFILDWRVKRLLAPAKGAA